MDKTKLVDVLKNKSLERIAAYLLKEPNFKFFQEGVLKFWNSTLPINLDDLARHLLMETDFIDSETLAEYLIQYSNATDISGIEILAIKGIKIDKPLELVDGIKLVPYEYIPDSYAKALYDITSVSENFNTRLLPKEIQNRFRDESQFFKSRRNETYEQDIKPTAALICNVTSSPKVIPLDSAGHIDEKLTKNKIRYYDLMDICNCLTLVGPCSPTPIASWWQPLEWVPDIGDSFGRMSLGVDLINITSQSFESIELKQKAKELTQNFFQLIPQDKKKLRISLERLSRAIRRKDLVDKAIELGIAMDSTFLDKQTELNYRLQLRAAWLLGETFQERIDIMKLFKKLYAVRSDAVHEGSIEPKYGTDDPDHLIQQGIEKVSKALEIILRDKKLPNWENLTLGQN